MIENRYHFLRRVANRLHELSPFFHFTKKVSLPFKIRRLKKKTGAFKLPESDLENDPLFTSVEIETMNRCNGDCGFCPVNRRQDPRPLKKMTEDLFRKIIDELSSLDFRGGVSLFSNNEPFLDTRIFEFAEYAKEKLPSAHRAISSNGILLDVEKYKRIMQSVDSITINNYCTDYVMRANIAAIAEYAERHPELWRRTNIQIRYENQAMTTRGGQAPNARRRLRKPLAIGCLAPAQQLIIRPDGKLSLCCNDALGTVTLGDADSDSLVHAWNSAPARAARRSVLQSRACFPICGGCDTL